MPSSAAAAASGVFTSSAANERPVCGLEVNQRDIYHIFVV
jgi:hypothetical protein